MSKSFFCSLIVSVSLLLITAEANAQCGCAPAYPVTAYYAPAPTTVYYAAPVTAYYAAPVTAYYAPAPVAVARTRYRPILGGTVTRVRYGYAPAYYYPAPTGVYYNNWRRPY